MKKELGVWIDHHAAVIVTVADDGEEIKRISSDMKKQGGLSAHSLADSPEARRARRFGEHLHSYYAEVMAAICAADSILILGPGEAKTELEKQLVQEKLSGRIVAIE